MWPTPLPTSRRGFDSWSRKQLFKHVIELISELHADDLIGPREARILAEEVRRAARLARNDLSFAARGVLLRFIRRVYHLSHVAHVLAEDEAGPLLEAAIFAAEAVALDARASAPPGAVSTGP